MRPRLDSVKLSDYSAAEMNEDLMSTLVNAPAKRKTSCEELAS